MVMGKKIIVEVLVEFHDGQMRPVSITWPDGRIFMVDRVLDVRQAADIKCGGIGIRYLCRIKGSEVPLYYGQDDHGHAEVWWCDGK